MNRVSQSSSPLLVTGMPRSGTTWLARMLASAPSSALTGREPMNPRGRQYALGGTLSGWTRLEHPTPRQRWALQTSYRGLNPFVYSRYGYRQASAFWPTVRNIVKDPFAMLSIPAVSRVTGAQVVLLFRHPAAMLASYRRMAWKPDLAELSAIVAKFCEQHSRTDGVVPLPRSVDLHEIDAMAWFWNALYGIALHDIRGCTRTLVLAHQDIASGDESARRALFRRMALRWGRNGELQRSEQQPVEQTVDDLALHNLERAPASVAQEWESKVTSDERRRIEERTSEIWTQLMARRYRVSDL